MFRGIILLFLGFILYQTNSFAEKIQAFNFSEEEFKQLKVRKIKKYTQYSLGSNEKALSTPPSALESVKCFSITVAPKAIEATAAPIPWV